MNKLILENKPHALMEEYYCELTRELDSLAGFDNKESWYFSHYILVDTYCIENKRLAIRIPGGTLGGISFDENNVVTALNVCTDYVVHTYPKNVNDIIQKYIGYTIEFPEDIKQRMRRYECMNKKDMSCTCGLNFEEMVSKRHRNEITEDEFQTWYNTNCMCCIHMCEICMYGE